MGSISWITVLLHVFHISQLFLFFSYLIALARTICMLLVTSWETEYHSLIPNYKVIIMKVSHQVLYLLSGWKRYPLLSKAVPFHAKLSCEFLSWMSTDFYQIFSLYLSRGQGSGKKEGKGGKKGRRGWRKTYRSYFYIKELIQQF